MDFSDHFVLFSRYLNDNDLSGEVPADLEKKLGSNFVYAPSPTSHFLDLFGNGSPL